MNEPILLSRKDAAQLISLSVRTLDYLVSSGELKPLRVGKKLLFRRAALEAFARRDHQIQKAGAGA